MYIKINTADALLLSIALLEYEENEIHHEKDRARANRLQETIRQAAVDYVQKKAGGQ